MRRLRVAGLAAGLVVAFAAGAVVASRTDPFPPGVEDPGARPTSAVPTEEPPEAIEWSFGLVSRTRHELHVGGVCQTSWSLRAPLVEDPGGTVAGQGEARSNSASCTTPTAQVQADTITVIVTGLRRGDTITIVLREAGRDPVGARDLGGFANTLPEMRFVFREPARRATALERVDLPDGNLGRYVSISRATLACRSGCEQA